MALASWGPSSFVRDGRRRAGPPSDPSLAKLAGRYVNDNPWFGARPVVERGGQLWIGTETPMTAIGDNLWRVGGESWSPERASFADFVDGRPQTFVYSGDELRPSRRLGVARGSAARSAAMDVLEAPRITPEIVAEHGLAPRRI